MPNDGLKRIGLRLLLCLASGLAGCTPHATGTFDDKGYQHTIYGYRVDATHAPDPKIAKENLLGEDWKLDNYYRDQELGLAPKTTDDYLTKFEFDTNGDGKPDFNKEELLYDLRFKHMKRDATIWLRTIPISDDLKDKELRVLLQRYVDEVSGAGFEAVKLGPTQTLLREKRFGATIVNRGSLKVAGQDAYQTTFDVANVDEVAVNPNARRVRVRIVLIRTPFQYSAVPTYTGDAKAYKYAVLMLAGYANLPEDFAKDEQDFQQLLEHTVIADQHGTTAVVLEDKANDTASDAKPPAPASEPPAAPPEPTAPTPAPAP